MAQYYHKEFGIGSLIQESSSTYIIRFANGKIEECPKSEVNVSFSAEDKLKLNEYDNFDSCLLHTQAALIQSINDSWGVFSKSNVDLLPHQLWVCNKVIQKWPFRYLIADDVGLGKTVEAGLILWPLISSGKVRRMLILTPAPLVDQWQYRMRKMFDIRLSKYTKEQDGPKSDFWNSHNLVVASMPSLSQVEENLRKERQQRLLESDKWDLIVVDEAHHMYADKKQGETLGFQLLEKIEDANKVDSCLFFTGTPHRGKDYGFWALMRLVNPNVFSEDKGNDIQYEQLSKYFIRNNKQNVTDMNGEKLFKELKQHPGTFEYTPQESEFYQKMTEFIMEGKAYASLQSASVSQQIMLVLISLQKIASSSIYAVKYAFKTRLSRFEKDIKKAEENPEQFEKEFLPDEIESLIDDEDEKKHLRENAKSFAELSFKLMQNEAEHLRELIELADNIKEESRITKIIETIEEKYPKEQVLFFTEYKRTQALMISALIDKWGEKSVGFINGDNYLLNIELKNGKTIEMRENRESSADKFNNGRIKYLVSTEAAGEGIDLQKNCHILVHVDLPWNPMRLHQRVGRLNRYGQAQSVDVLSFRNMETVESMIWEKLQTKLIQIEKMFVAGMEDPEDIMQLVIGMQNQNLFDDIYSEGLTQKKDKFDEWFDKKTQTLGGKKVIETVQNILGNAARFNLTGLDSVPKLDLPDLIPFFKNAVKSTGRRIRTDDNIHFSFITPDIWKTEFGIKDDYENIIFKRKVEGNESPDDICGVGHKIFQKALDFAKNKKESVCLIDGTSSYFVFRVFDKITYSRGTVSNKYLIVKKTDNRYEPINEDIFYKTLDSLQPYCSEYKTAAFNDIENINGVVKSYIEESNNFDFREPDYELYSAFIKV